VSHSAGDGADSPRFVDGADLDHDGDVDVVCCNGYSSDVSVFLNDGAGGLTVQTPRLAVETSPNFLEARDFDGDGNADVVTVNAGPGSISFLRGHGDGTFESARHYGVGGTLPYGLQVCDVDGDLDLDVVVPIRGTTPSAWRVLRNYGTGTFGLGELHPGGTHCHTVGVADWDLDGDLDVVAGFAVSQNMYLYAQAPVPAVVAADPPANATGAPLADPVRLWFSTELAPVDPAAVVVRGAQSGPIGVDLAWSASSKLLTLTPPTPFLPGEIVTVTIRGDGLVESDEGVPLPGFALEFMAEGAASTGGFTPHPIAIAGSDPVDLAVADFDDDGVGDVIVANYLSNDATLLLAAEGGLLEVSATLPVGTGPVAVCPGDFDGDGAVDAALANLVGRSISLLTNVGGGVLLGGATVPTAGSPFGLNTGDFDLDGDLDLAVAEVDPNGVRVYWNDGAGSFPTSVDLGATGLPLDVAVADLDRDGDLDVISVDSAGDRVEVFLGQDGGFSSGGSYPTGDAPIHLFPWDTDGDGAIDLVTANYGSDDISILPNSGDGTFAPAATIDAGSSPRGLWGADLTGDGNLDLAVTSSGGSDVTVFRNLGGSFDEGTALPVGVAPYAVAGGDWNGDGRVDLATVNRQTGDLTVLLNGATTGVGPGAGGSLGTRLVGAQPNPFREEASIRLDLARPMPVLVRVFDLRGRSVATLLDGPLPTGSHRVRWDGRDRGGQRVATGVYFVRMDAGEGSWTRKLLRIR